VASKSKVSALDDATTSLLAIPSWLALLKAEQAASEDDIMPNDDTIDSSCTMIVLHATGMDRLLGSIEHVCTELEREGSASDAIDSDEDDNGDHHQSNETLLFGPRSRHFMLKTFFESMLTYLLSVVDKLDRASTAVRQDGRVASSLFLQDVLADLVSCRQSKTRSLASGMLSRLLLLQCAVVAGRRRQEEDGGNKWHRQRIDTASRAGRLLAWAEHVSLAQAADLLERLMIVSSPPADDAADKDQAVRIHSLYAFAASAFLCSFVENAQATRMPSLRDFLSNNPRGMHMLKTALSFAAAQANVAAIGTLLLAHSLPHQCAHGCGKDDVRCVVPCIGPAVAAKALGGVSGNLSGTMTRFLEAIMRQYPARKEEARILLQGALAVCVKTEVKGADAVAQVATSSETIMCLYDLCGIRIMFHCSAEDDARATNCWRPTVLCTRVLRDVSNGSAAVLKCVRSACTKVSFSREGAPARRFVTRESITYGKLAKLAVELLGYEAVWAAVTVDAEKSLVVDLVAWLFGACYSKDDSQREMFGALEELLEMQVSSMTGNSGGRRGGVGVGVGEGGGGGGGGGCEYKKDVSDWMTLLAAVYVIRVSKNSAGEVGESTIVSPNTMMRLPALHWLEPWLQSASLSSMRKLMRILVPGAERPQLRPHFCVVTLMAETAAAAADRRWPSPRPPSMRRRSRRVGRLEAVQIVCLSGLGDLGDTTRALIQIGMRAEQFDTASAGRKYSGEGDGNVRVEMNSGGGSDESTSVGQLFAAFCHQHCKSQRAVQDILDALCSDSVTPRESLSMSRHLIVQMCQHCLSSTVIAAENRMLNGVAQVDGERISGLNALPDHANILFFGGALQAMHRSRLAEHAIEDLIGTKVEGRP
jgi:hypothetical protein